MSLKMKLVSMISAFVLVIGMLLIGVFAVERVQVDMGGSITFNADDVYARVTGNVAKAQVAPEELGVTYSATGTTGNPTAWESLDLEFDSYATPIVISITVENLSTERSLTVNLIDALTSSAPNLGKALQRDNSTYTSGTNITLDPKDNGTSTTTFTITLSVADRNQSLTNAQFDYDLNLFDESVTPSEDVEILEDFMFDDSGNLISYTGTDSVVTVPSSYSMIGEPTTKSLDFETVDSTNEYAMTLVSLTNFKLTTDDGEEYIFEDYGEMASSLYPESYFPCTIEYKDYSNVTFTTGSDYQVEGVVGAFAFNQTIQTVNLPNSIKNIGFYSFMSSTLKEIPLPEGLTSIGIAAFTECSGLTSIALPEGLTSIGNDTFYGCDSLASIDLPEGLTSIGNYAFSYCSGLTGTVTIPASVNEIGANPFRSCSNLDGIAVESENSSYYVEGNCLIEKSTKTLIKGFNNSTIPSDIKVIGDYAFATCRGFTSITLPSSLTRIGGYAFFDCYDITSITLPSSLTSIGANAFDGCTNLASVTFKNTEGWKRSTSSDMSSSSSVIVTNPSTNATYLKNTYVNYYWQRG